MHDCCDENPYKFTKTNNQLPLDHMLSIFNSNHLRERPTTCLLRHGRMVQTDGDVDIITAAHELVNTEC